ncbi:transcriptional regulator BetI [Roseibacterium sp. SDUM158017]|uniref:choline-binding transcriptional repressor BetI n=1 Tax=Roseicyclus salinarum TaxID=3036773 RepID=UPI0024150230|nr:transcriptional regulator BetI [Roseibacterium sp. SDUM158017]MDG4647739.1 transcriptional regulator BetI [Roseibacterium sp. SDUM158017]
MSERRTESLRREELVEAAILEIGATGSLDVTVGQIARRAGVSPALAFHYFGGKDRLFLAAMRAILSLYGAEVRGALMTATGPKERLAALVRASFGPSNFRREVVAAWLNFYVLAATDPAARRLLTVYQRRLRSNLVHELRPLADARAPGIAERVAGLIDGLYLRAALDPDAMTAGTATAHVLAALDHETGARA